MRKTSRMKHGAIALMALTTSVTSMAYEPGDWVVRAGYAAVNPDDSSSALKADGAPVAGTQVSVDDNARLGLTASYIFAPHWGIEVLAATPFKHVLGVDGLGGLGVPNGTRLGSTRHLPPTVSVQYYFANSASKWQPYVGIGVNYTTFFSEDLSSEAENALGASDLSLDDSIGLAFEIGMDWMVNQNWVVSASIWKVDIETDASFNTALGRITSTVTIDPIVYMLGVGYKF